MSVSWVVFVSQICSSIHPSLRLPLSLGDHGLPWAVRNIRFFCYYCSRCRGVHGGNSRSSYVLSVFLWSRFPGVSFLFTADSVNVLISRSRSGVVLGGRHDWFLITTLCPCVIFLCSCDFWHIYLLSFSVRLAHFSNWSWNPQNCVFSLHVSSPHTFLNLYFL